MSRRGARARGFAGAVRYSRKVKPTRRAPSSGGFARGRRRSRVAAGPGLRLGSIAGTGGTFTTLSRAPSLETLDRVRVAGLARARTRPGKWTDIAGSNARARARRDSALGVRGGARRRVFPDRALRGRHRGAARSPRRHTRTRGSHRRAGRAASLAHGAGANLFSTLAALFPVAGRGVRFRRPTARALPRSARADAPPRAPSAPSGVLRSPLPPPARSGSLSPSRPRRRPRADRPPPPPPGRPTHRQQRALSCHPAPVLIGCGISRRVDGPSRGRPCRSGRAPS